MTAANEVEVEVVASTNDELLTRIEASMKLLKYESKTYLSGYELAKLVSTIRKIEMKPQMTYNYIKKSMIKSIEVDERKVVATQDAIAWIIKYVTRNA